MFDNDNEFDNAFVTFFKTKPSDKDLLTFVKEHTASKVFEAIDAKIGQVDRSKAERNLRLQEVALDGDAERREVADAQLDYNKWARGANIFRSAMTEARGRIKRLMSENGLVIPVANRNWSESIEATIPILERIAVALERLADAHEDLTDTVEARTPEESLSGAGA